MIVLDASALIDVVIDQPTAEWVLDQIDDDVGEPRRAFALRERIRVLDGLYVVLADELDCPLVTTDRRLGGADAPCDVRLPPRPVPPPRDD